MIVREIFTRMGILMDAKSAKSAGEVLENLKTKAVQLVAAYATMKGVSAIIDMVDDTAKLGAEVLKLSQRFGLATDQLQKLQFAAEQSLVSNEEFAFSFRFLERNAYEATQGNKEALRNFARLGVSVKDASGKLKPAGDILLDVADSMKGISNESERTAVAQALFGRAGYKMIPMLIQGRDGIVAQGKAAQELGGIMDKELIQQSLKYVQVQKQVQFAIQGVKNRISSVLIPAITKGEEKFLLWIKSHRDLVDELIPFTKHVLNVAYAIGDVVKWVVQGVYWLGKTAAEFAVGKKWALEFAIALGVLGLAFASPVFAIGAFIIAIGALIQDYQVWHDTHGKSITLFGGMLYWLRQITSESAKTGKWGFFSSLADNVMMIKDNWSNFTTMLKQDVNEVSYLVDQILLLAEAIKGIYDTLNIPAYAMLRLSSGISGAGGAFVRNMWAGSAEARRTDYINTLNLEHHTMVSVTGSPSGLPYHANSDEIVRKIEESNENAHKRAFEHFRRR